MKSNHIVRAAMVAVALSSAATLFAAPVTTDEYRAAKSRIEAEYKDSKAACDALSENAKDVCREEAKGKQKVARAELEYNRSGKPDDATKLATTKADAAYAVAKEKCGDRSGNDKDVCVKEAKTAHTKALADAKADKKVGEARKDAAEDKRDADYNLAKEKCDGLAGDNKSSCLATARARYGKS
ncbi:MAG: hypothetical protein M3Y67_08875 [Pseudomonadota bacterium]|nr:hypothetical protein [Pseudomonadota bacterium]